jgi:hypothetical protein
MKKTIIVFLIFVILVCAGCENHSNTNKNPANISEDYEEDTQYGNDTEIFENVQQFYNSITDDMLNAFETYPSFDSYWNDSLVLLNQFDEDVRLYGINVNGQTAMLLSINGEKVLIEEDLFPSFQNLYQELPILNVFDVDGDGADEVMISLRTVTGSPISRYAMLVCNREDEWNIYMYHDYLEDVKDIIQYRYDDENNSITFLDNKDNVLWEGKLPEWTKEYTYAGTVNFGDNIRFDAETFQMDIVPGIELENSLPYEPIKITFNLGFMDGEFKIVGYDINAYRRIEEGENQ